MTAQQVPVLVDNVLTDFSRSRAFVMRASRAQAVSQKLTSAVQIRVCTASASMHLRFILVSAMLVSWAQFATQRKTSAAHFRASLANVSIT